MLYYLLWQWFAFRWLCENVATTQFDLVHHVTFASVRYPTFMGRLGIPFYFGPVGGGETVPASLCASFGYKERLREFIRRTSNRLVGLSPLSRSALQDASKILVTRDTLPLIPREFQNKCQVQLAIGSTETRKLRQPSTLRGASASRCGFCMSAGSSNPRVWTSRSMRCRLLKQIRLDARLTIVGDGAARSSLLELCRALDLTAEVDWLGWLPPGKSGRTLRRPPTYFCSPACATPEAWRCWKPCRTACPWCAPTWAAPALSSTTRAAG